MHDIHKLSLLHLHKDSIHEPFILKILDIYMFHQVAGTGFTVKCR